MACGCGCNGVNNGCGGSMQGLGAEDWGWPVGYDPSTASYVQDQPAQIQSTTYVPVPMQSSMDGWLKDMLPMVLIGAVGLFMLWRR